MDFTITFIKVLAITVYFVSPILAFLIAAVTCIGLMVGRVEKWSFSDSLYFTFITATTVGYGDFRPTKGKTKFAAIVIAGVGIVLTGIIVAIAVNSVEITFKRHYDIEQLNQKFQSELE